MRYTHVVLHKNTSHCGPEAAMTSFLRFYFIPVPVFLFSIFIQLTPIAPDSPVRLVGLQVFVVEAPPRPAGMQG